MADASAPLFNGAPSTTTPNILGQVATSVGQTDPGLAGLAEGVLKTPKFLVGEALKGLSVPGNLVQHALFGGQTAEQFLGNTIKGNGLGPSLARGLGGFALDAATNPLTYVTGGTEGIAQDAAESGLLSAGLHNIAENGLSKLPDELGALRLTPDALSAAKEAEMSGGPSMAQFAADHPDPLVSGLANGTIGQTSYARALENARELLPGSADGSVPSVVDGLPNSLKGGVSLKVPFTDVRANIIPGSVTQPVTAAIGDFVKEGILPAGAESVPGLQKLADAVSSAYGSAAHGLSVPWSFLHAARQLPQDAAAPLEDAALTSLGVDTAGMTPEAVDTIRNSTSLANPAEAGSGLKGALLLNTQRGAKALMSVDNSAVTSFINDASRQFPDLSVLRNAVEQPGSVALTAEQAALVDRFTQQLAPKLLQSARSAGYDVPDMGPTWLPRVYSDDAKALMTAGLPKAAAEAGAHDIFTYTPGSAMSRNLTMPFDEANAMETSRLGAKGLPAGAQAFETNPLRALLKSATSTNAAVYQQTLADAVANSGLDPALVDAIGVKSSASYLLKQYDDFTNEFKKWSTVPFPHNWLKRVATNWYALAARGVSMGEISDGIKFANTDAASDGAEVIGTHTVAEWKQMADSQGVLGNKVTELKADLNPQTAEAQSGLQIGLHRPGFGVPGLEQVSKTATGVGAAVLNKIDAASRMAAFMHGVDEFGDLSAARAFVMQGSGDFGENTAFETSVLKRAVPFYKWLRVQTPLLLKTTLENPGFASNVTAGTQDILGDPNATAQAYASGMMPTNAAVAGGFMSSPLLQPLMNLFGAAGAEQPVSVQNPLYGLNQYEEPLSELNPVVSALLGHLTSTQSYPDGTSPIPLADTVPVKGVYRYLASAMEHIPGLSGLVARTPSGDLRMSGSFNALLSALPSQTVTSLADTLGGGGTGVLKEFSPITAYPYTAAVQQGELQGQKDKLKNLIQELSRRGEVKTYDAISKANGVPYSF